MDKRPCVVLISDNAAWRTSLKQVLKEQGIDAIGVDTKEKALEQPFHHNVAALLYDLSMQQSPIKTACRFLRDAVACKTIPLIIFIREQQLAQIDATLGIDDFIIQRENFQEAVIRVRQVFGRRLYAKHREALTIKDLAIDLENYEASIHGVPIYLTFKEFELLKFLVLNRGRVFSRDELLDKFWGYDNYAGTRTVDIHIQRIRTKLGRAVGDLIVTVRNVGYKFVTD